MAEDWSIDVRKYAPDADASVIAAIVRYCGIALQNRDSSLVSFSDPAETDRVRENYLKKKLGLTDSDEVLDEAIADVGERMRADPTKNRVTVYYLLAEKLRRLSVFGGVDRVVGLGAAVAGGAAAATAMAASAAATPAAAVVADHPIERPVERPIPAAAPYAARPAAAAPAKRGVGWWPWLLLAALAALAAWFFLANRRPAEVATAPAVAPAVTTPVAPAAPAPAPAIAAPPAEVAAAPPAVTAGLPATVHFPLGSAVLSDADRAAINTAAAAATADGARLFVTGYTDRTGNLPLNERLAQSRATAVRDALVAAGVPAANIEMRPPAAVENGPTRTPDAEARRVEIGRL